MSVDASFVRAPDPSAGTSAVPNEPSHARGPVDASRPGDPWLVLRLSRLVREEPGVRLGALVRSDRRTGGGDDGVLTWPLATRLPRGTRELAARALESGRATRVPIACEGADVEELLALPLGAALPFCTLVLALGGVDDVRRAALLRAARERFGHPDAAGGPPERGGVTRATPPRTPRADLSPPGDAERSAIDRAALEALARHGDARSLALATADTAATSFACRRVSIVVDGPGAPVLLAVSGESRPDPRRTLGRCLIDVAVEARRHGGARWPRAAEDGAAADEEPVDLPAHRALHAASDSLALLSTTTRSASGARVVAVLERAADRAFTSAEAARIESALAAALASGGELHARERRGVSRGVARLREAWADTLAGRPSARLLIATPLAAALAFACVVPLPYRVAGRAVVEASDRQVLVAPEAGHIATAHARAGDTVAAGELLATLDDRELALAHERWRGERAKNAAEQSRALASRDRVELARLRADAVRIEAETALVEARRARGEIRAPFDGVVLSGDPTRSLGAPVAAGDVLFEVGAGERGLSIEIDERDIALVASGASARVRMAASPRDVREAHLDTIVPVAVSEDGREVFRVPATLIDDGARPSPGMQGVARVEAGRRTLADAWTRALRERLLLIAWRFGLVR